MKTSNKLIIAFALALIVIPVLGVIFVSQAYYKTGSYDEVFKLENFATPTVGMTSLTAPAPFQSVDVKNGQGLTLRIYLIKDEKFGVKIPESLKDRIAIGVENGQLQVDIKAASNKENAHYANIYVYGQNLSGINAAQTGWVYINTQMDSLNLNIKTAQGVSIDEDSKLKSLIINAEDSHEVNISQVNMQLLTATLKNTSFKTESSSYNNLSVTSDGGEDLEIKGNDYDGKKYEINNLALITLGKTNVKVENIKINNCSGKLSDETQVEMPAVNLNQMYKK